MAYQVENTLTEVDEAMHKLKTAYRDIKIRREFFGHTYKGLTRAVARLSVEIADNAGGFDLD